MSSNNSFKNKVAYKLFAYKLFINIKKKDLALNNPQEFICYKTPTNQP